MSTQPPRPPSDDQPEVTPGGSVVSRHKPREAGDLMRDLSPGDEGLIGVIDDHILRHVGKVERVFHELVSPLVHIDVHVVPPGGGRDFHTLVTSGMSEREMKVAEGDPCSPFMELCCVLPAEWRLDETAFEDERWYWPVRWLKQLARLPHEYGTYLGYGHTVPNGDPPEPFAAETGLCCTMVTFPYPFEEPFHTLELPSRTIEFMMMIPLYREEMELKLKRGAEALEKKFANIEVCDLFQPTRKNFAAKRWGLF